MLAAHADHVMVGHDWSFGLQPDLKVWPSCRHPSKIPTTHLYAESTAIRAALAVGGAGVERSQMVLRLRRHRDLFHNIGTGRTLPGRLRLFLHEVLATRGINLLWAVQVRLPWIGKRRKKSIAQSIVCPFMGFDDDQEESVGCMIHPTRFEERDIRSAVAFTLLPGISCGDANYVCTGCTRFNDMPADQTRVFLDVVRSQDWYEYTRTIRAFSCSAIVPMNDSASEKQGDAA